MAGWLIHLDSGVRLNRGGKNWSGEGGGAKVSVTYVTRVGVHHECVLVQSRTLSLSFIKIQRPLEEERFVLGTVLSTSMQQFLEFL